MLRCPRRACAAKAKALPASSLRRHGSGAGNRTRGAARGGAHGPRRVRRGCSLRRRLQEGASPARRKQPRAQKFAFEAGRARCKESAAPRALCATTFARMHRSRREHALCVPWVRRGRRRTGHARVRALARRSSVAKVWCARLPCVQSLRVSAPWAPPERLVSAMPFMPLMVLLCSAVDAPVHSSLANGYFLGRGVPGGRLLHGRLERRAGRRAAAGGCRRRLGLGRGQGAAARAQAARWDGGAAACASVEVAFPCAHEGN